LAVDFHGQAAEERAVGHREAEGAFEHAVGVVHEAVRDLDAGHVAELLRLDVHAFQAEPERLAGVGPHRQAADAARFVLDVRRGERIGPAGTRCGTRGGGAAGEERERQSEPERRRKSSEHHAPPGATPMRAAVTWSFCTNNRYGYTLRRSLLRPSSSTT